MSDKIKSGISVRTTFVDGETPKAAKLNSLSSQLQAACTRLENVIGDVHSESYPYSTFTASRLSGEYGRKYSQSGALDDTSGRDLDIVNLGRIIGPASNLNPHFLDDGLLTEDVPVGVHEFCLDCVPDDTSTLVFSDSAVFALYVSDPNDLSSAGDFYVDSYGRIYSVSETNGGTVTYSTNPRAWAAGNTYQDSSFNVIPDPNQLLAGSGCSVGAIDGNGRRAVTLPTVTHHHYNSDGATVELSSADPTYGQQLTLPKILENWTAGEEIPTGYLYLKNYTKNVVYKAATYYYSSPTSIQIGNEDISTHVDDGDLFCIITVGTDICTSIDDLRRKARHSHDRHYGEPLIPVDAIKGILSVPGNRGQYMPSEIPGNYFPQYLHRDGYTEGVDDNLNDENTMRGDVVLGAEGADAGASNSLGGVASYKLKFFGGNGVDRASIYQSLSGGLILDSEATGSSGSGVHALPTLVLHEGIRSDIYDDAGFGFTYNIPIKPLSFTVSDTVTGTNYIAYDLNTSFGFPSTATVYAIDVMTDTPLASSIFYGPHTPGAETSWIYNEVSHVLTVYFDAVMWPDPSDVTLRIVIWYNDN